EDPGVDDAEEVVVRFQAKRLRQVGKPGDQRNPVLAGPAGHELVVGRDAAHHVPAIEKCLGALYRERGLADDPEGGRRGQRREFSALMRRNDLGTFGPRNGWNASREGRMAQWRCQTLPPGGAVERAGVASHRNCQKSCPSRGGAPFMQWMSPLLQAHVRNSFTATT